MPQSTFPMVYWHEIYDILLRGKNILQFKKKSTYFKGFHFAFNGLMKFFEVKQKLITVERDRTCYGFNFISKGSSRNRYFLLTRKLDRQGTSEWQKSQVKWSVIQFIRRSLVILRDIIHCGLHKRVLELCVLKH